MAKPRTLAIAVPFLALASACAASARRPAGPDAPRGPVEPEVHHELRVALDPVARRVAVEDAVTLAPALRARADEVVFSLHAGLAPERIGGAAVEPAGDGAARAQDGGVPLERFRIRLAPGERTFTLRYAGEIFHPVVEQGDGPRRDGVSPGLVSPEGAVLHGASGWIPDVGAASVSFALDVRLPAGWEAVSQGRRVRHARGGDGTDARWESPEPQEEVFLVAAPLVERSRDAGRVAVQTFLRADDAALATTYLDAGERYLAMYERLLGPYPYPKFALVENFWETGYGMPSFTLLGPRVIRLPFLVHSSYPHEILHNWWGNGVFVDASRGNWSEGLTAYLADHLVQEARGQGAEHRRAALQRFADYVAANADFPVREFRARHGEVTQSVGYDKVLMVFHMLRQRLGDERFVAGLRRFYAAHRFRPASFTDLERAMSAAAGEDLAPWFAAWLDRAGAPSLRLDAAAAVEQGGRPALELRLAQTQPGAPFALDVPVAITVAGSGEAIRRTVRLAERSRVFTLPLDAPPVRVDVDPELDVFRRLDAAELPPALGGAFGAGAALFVLPSAAPPELRAAYAELAARWKGDGGEIVSDAGLERLPPGRAVWVLGWENRLRPAAAEALAAQGATLGADGLRAGATVLSREEHAIAAAARGPREGAQVVAFVAADRAEPLAGVARKLPHYGRYGLVAFRGDEAVNSAKEIWPVLRSPLAAATSPGELPPRGALPPRAPLATPPR
jgi:hypothetical protein